MSCSGIAEFGPEAAIDINTLRARWFDRWFNGEQNGVESEAPVRLFVMVGGDARSSPATTAPSNMIRPAVGCWPRAPETC